MSGFDGNTYNEDKMRKLMGDTKVACNNLSSAHTDAELSNKFWDKVTKYPGLLASTAVSLLAVIFAVHPNENSEIYLAVLSAVGTLFAGYNAVNNFSGKAAAHNFSAGGYGGMVGQIDSAFIWDQIPDRVVQSIIERVGFQNSLAPTLPTGIASKYNVAPSSMPSVPTPLPQFNKITPMNQVPVVDATVKTV